MFHFARYASVYELIFTCCCWHFSHVISLHKILCQGISRTWWRYIDAFSPTFSCIPYFSLLPFHWPSSLPFRPCSLTFMLAKLMPEDVVQHSHSAALGFSYSSYHCLVLYSIHCVPLCQLCFHLYCTRYYSSSANFWCPKCFQVDYPHYQGLHYGRW